MSALTPGIDSEPSVADVIEHVLKGVRIYGGVERRHSARFTRRRVRRSPGQPARPGTAPPPARIH